MRYDDPQLIDDLAGAYVIGTLRGPARDRFEKLCIRSSTARAAVRRWEDRLLGVSLALRPVTPNPRVLNELRLRLGVRAAKSTVRPAQSAPFKFALAASIVALVVAISWLSLHRASPVQSYALFAETGGAQLWRVEQHADGQLSMTTLSGAAVPPANKSYELWALPQGKNPVSLGVMPASGNAAHPLSAAQLAALATSPKLAISVEPAGGSPTGAPTGPVVHVVEFVRKA